MDEETSGTRVGIGSISNVVDITNYILKELVNLCAFDFSTLKAMPFM